MAVNPIPEGYPQVIPYLSIQGAEKAIAFYSDVLGFKEFVRMGGPEGKIGHAELKLGDSVLMLSDEMPDMGNNSPKTIGGSPVTVCIYVEDVDDVFKRALEAGAKEISPLNDQFYGDRSGQFEDPFGHRWNVSSHIEDVPPEEMEKRMAEMMQGGG